MCDWKILNKKNKKIKLAEKCVTFIIPKFKPLLQFWYKWQNLKTIDWISFFKSYWNKQDTGKFRQILIHIHRNRQKYWCILALTNEHLLSHSYITASTHRRSTNTIFPIRCQSFLYNKSGEKKKISIWFKWHHVIFLFIFPNNWEKNKLLSH